MPFYCYSYDPGYCLELLLVQNLYSALAGVAQWVECQPVNQRVTSSIPSQGARLGCGPGPQLGACERQPHIDVSLSLPLSLKINNYTLV